MTLKKTWFRGCGGSDGGSLIPFRKVISPSSPPSFIKNEQGDLYELNLQSKCNKKRSTHQLEYNFVSTQKPFPNDEYFLPTS
ncbi:hypothetical protein, partial [Escherichia coli]|uniref:hypothetical protein n=1 Tax=Escherichia coli TaxID=562 RepID=UPI0028A37CC7